MRYRTRLWNRAKTDTLELTGPKHRAEAMVSAASFIVVTAMLYFVGGIGPTFDSVRLVVVGWLSFVVTFAGVFVYNIVAAPSRLAAEDAASIESAQLEIERQRLLMAPTLRLSPGAVHEIGGVGPLAFVSVENVGDSEAKNCRGRLIAITSMQGERRQLLDVPLAWSQPDDPTDPSRKSFYGSARLNVATRGSNPNVLVPTAARPLDGVDQRAAQFARDRDVLVGIEVTADGSAPTRGWFRLAWRSFVLVENEETSTTTMYDLHGVQLEFEDADDRQGAPPGSSRFTEE